MTETPKETREGEITEMFAHRLEQTIRRNRHTGYGLINAGN